MKQAESKQNFQDQTLQCTDCGQTFTWTSGEQRFYFSKGLSKPKRCRSCRELRKRTLNPDPGVGNG